MIRPMDRSPDYSDSLNLDEQFRTCQTRNCDQCARREIVPEDLLPQLGEAVPIPSIGNEHVIVTMSAKVPPVSARVWLNRENISRT